MTIDATAITNITRAEAADSASWTDIGGGPGSGQDDGIVVDGTESRSRRIDNNTRGFGFTNGANADLSAAGTHVGFWVNVLQPAQLTSVDLSISDSATGPQSGNWDGHTYNGSEIPKVGGWQRVWVDLSRTRNSGSGTLNLANCRSFGGQFIMGDVGGTTGNCLLDRMDYTPSGLRINGGTVGTPSDFAELITDDDTNSYGLIAEGVINGPIEIGGAATEFNDTNFSFVAGNQPLAEAGWQRIDIINDSANINITLGSYFLEGIPINITGTTSSGFDLGTGTLLNAPAMSWNSSIKFAGSLVASGTLTQNGADLDGATFSGTTGTVAVIVDDLTKLEGARFVGDNSTYAVDLGTIAASTTLTWDTDFDTTTYAASDGSTGSEVILVNYTDTVTPLTINVAAGRPTPSVHNTGAGTVNVVSGQVTIDVNVKDADGVTNLLDAGVYIYEDGNTSNVYINGMTNASGNISSSPFTYTTDINFKGWVRQNDLLGTDYEAKEISGTITSIGATVNVLLDPI